MYPGITLGPTCSHSTRKRNKLSRKSNFPRKRTCRYWRSYEFDQVLELAWESHRGPRNGQGGTLLVFICRRLSRAVDRRPVRFWLQEAVSPPA
jgi:hypothetical protein